MKNSQEKDLPLEKETEELESKITITSFLAELAILPELVMSLLIFRVMIVHEDVLWPVMGLC